MGADDLAIKLTNVTALVEGDLFLGSLATGGNTITLNAANASVATTGTTVNAVETTVGGANTPAGSTNTTAFNDTVTSTLTNLAGATLTGGTGTDTLALSIAAGQAAFTMATSVTEFEAITLANFAPSSAANNTTFSVTLAAGNVAANTTLTVTNNNTGTDFDGTVGNDRTVFTGTNALSSTDRKLSYTGSAGSESITGGTGNDTINGGAGNDKIFGAAGTNTLNGQDGDDAITSASLTDSVDGGAGNDTVTVITGAYTGSLVGSTGVADVLAVVHNTDITGATVSGFETIDFAGATTSILLATVAQVAATTSITSTGAAAATTSTITLDATTVAKATGTVTVDPDVKIYTVAASAAAGVTINGTSAGTDVFSVTGGAGADVINFGSHGAAQLTLIGGAGNDTITVATSTLTAADVLQGGDGAGDKLVLAGNVALGVAGTNVSATLVTSFETIEIQNTTTNVFIDLVDAGLASGDTLTITTSQTSGTLTLNGVLEADGKLVITGGGSDDTLVGGLVADTISGGAGSDSISGSAGNDVINGDANNDVLRGGLGADTISGGTGGDVFDILAGDSITDLTASAVAFIDQILDFDVTVDRIVLSAADFAAANGTAAASQAATTTGAAGSVAAAAGLKIDAAPGATTVATGAAYNLVKITGTTGTTFTSALNGGSITATDDAAGSSTYVVVYFDADRAVGSFTGSMVISLITSANASIEAANDAASENIIAIVGMSTADFGTFGNSNITFA